LRRNDCSTACHGHHHVAYDDVNDEGWVRSELKRLREAVSSKQFIAEVSEEWERAHRRWWGDDAAFGALLETFVKAAQARDVEWSIERLMAPRELATQLRERFSPPAAVALFARFGLGAELYFVTRTS